MADQTAVWANPRPADKSVEPTDIEELDALLAEANAAAQQAVPNLRKTVVPTKEAMQPPAIAVDPPPAASPSEQWRPTEPAEAGPPVIDHAEPAAQVLTDPAPPHVDAAAEKRGPAKPPRPQPTTTSHHSLITRPATLLVLAPTWLVTPVLASARLAGSVLELIDRPFTWIPLSMKQILGYAALVTLLMAAGVFIVSLAVV
jgi:hypothetical protein